MRQSCSRLFRYSALLPLADALPIHIVGSLPTESMAGTRVVGQSHGPWTTYHHIGQTETRLGLAMAPLGLSHRPPCRRIEGIETNVRFTGARSYTPYRQLAENTVLSLSQLPASFYTSGIGLLIRCCALSYWILALGALQRSASRPAQRTPFT
jgi:hypothetical protein